MIRRVEHFSAYPDIAPLKPVFATRPTVGKFLKQNLFLLACIMLALMAPWPSANAQETGTPAPPTDVVLTPANVEQAHTRLIEIESSIAINAEKIEALGNEISRLDGDRVKQSAALVAAAQRVKLAEIEVTAIEDRLITLLASEHDIQTRLDGADGDTFHLLATLQRISISPPPALIVDPGDAISSARSAALLSAILPQLRERAQSVSIDLKLLLEIRQAAEEEEALLRGNLRTLHEERLRIATLIEARNRSVAHARSELKNEQDEAEALAANAKSLDELLRELGDNISSISDASDAAFNSGTANGSIPNDPETILLAFANAEREAPAIPFAAARGYLTQPAAGVTISRFGGNDGFGGLTKGISMVTRAKAQIVSPADAWVMYKGPYLNYGQIVILNPGQGYTILLAGLDGADVDLGQFVMMGEPIGTMGSRTVGQAVTTSAGVSRPTLYIEFRQHDTPLDPSAWWVEKDNKTQSG